MKGLFDRLSADIRVQEGLKACINCGTCTAICPAAGFYNYDPRILTDMVQKRDDNVIEELLKGEFIWYCGECMSCKSRCPRGNVPGLLITALRALSQELGFFTMSEKGRQQLAVKRTVGEWIIKHGYCLYLEGAGTEVHPEQGPIWDWVQGNWRDVFDKMEANYQGSGPGILRKIPEESMEELRRIFDVTGGTARFEQIEKCSEEKAAEMGMEYSKDSDCEYLRHVCLANEKDHNRH
ncbi:MAG: 4Fe-4S dicluster domain-containing protein [Bacteroidetes bacterium]|nr:4Fe-4S dicluster domain-containing protein [Bacteroidota bacterium]MBU1720456.1 4Fe-4S dicluster domain-containing protein [Bacteroidota bacterium]